MCKTYKKLNCGIGVNYCHHCYYGTLTVGSVFWVLWGRQSTLHVRIILLTPHAHPVTWDSSHLHLSQVDTELLREHEADPGLTYHCKWKNWSSNSKRITPVFKFWPLFPMAKIRCKCQSQEIGRPLCSVPCHLQSSVKSDFQRPAH